MAKKKTGDLIKDARTKAGLTQEALSKKVTDVTAADISKAERGELQLTQAQLKEIAKATGVTQKSLLDSVSSSNAKTSSAKASSAKTSSAGKAEVSGTGKKTSSGKTSSTDLKLTETEKKLIKLYRAADAQAKKEAMAVLEEKKSDLGNMVSSLLNNKAVKDVVSGLLKS
ncbi:MAG: helix-turn-helix domain-containing protein [Lachnospiraceae bacterium]|nr:helix-turn-helix domain-containing protein [Lachnospiraceae bacterium]